MIHGSGQAVDGKHHRGAVAVVELINVVDVERRVSPPGFLSVIPVLNQTHAFVECACYVAGGLGCGGDLVDEVLGHGGWVGRAVGVAVGAVSSRWSSRSRWCTWPCEWTCPGLH